MPTRPLAPQQQRSRKTLESLLAATVRLLDKDSLEACTLPRIATEAGVSAASVYRRFPDKDALIRAAFLQVLQQSNTANKSQLAKLLRSTLEETVEAIVGALLRQYRSHPRLLRALSVFVDSNAQSEFAQQANRLIADNLHMVSAVLLEHRDRIRHTNPQRAVTFAVLQAASAIEIAVLGTESLWDVALPLTDKQFAAELTRAMLGYLRRKS